jgi:hypothetical protein
MARPASLDRALLWPTLRLEFILASAISDRHLHIARPDVARSTG